MLGKLVVEVARVQPFVEHDDGGDVGVVVAQLAVPAHGVNGRRARGHRQADDRVALDRPQQLPFAHDHGGVVRIRQHHDERIPEFLRGLELGGGVVDLRADRLQEVLHGAGDHGLRRRRELLDLAQARESADLDWVVDPPSRAEIRLVLRDDDATLREVALKQEVAVASLAHVASVMATAAGASSARRPTFPRAGPRV